MNISKFLALVIPTVFGILVSAPAFSSSDFVPGKSATATTAPSWVSEVTVHIRARKFDDAIEKLQEANDINSADWNNLMGYSMRKKATPDLIASEKYYQAALKIDPSHKGTLEYYGELMLMKDDLAGAENLLDQLNKACPSGCEELSTLKSAIARFKANTKASDY
jgi:tetratricopeptide (TPR) repeat protein